MFFASSCSRLRRVLMICLFRRKPLQTDRMTGESTHRSNRDLSVPMLSHFSISYKQSRPSPTQCLHPRRSGTPLKPGLTSFRASPPERRTARNKACSITFSLTKFPFRMMTEGQNPPDFPIYACADAGARFLTPVINKINNIKISCHVSHIHILLQIPVNRNTYSEISGTLIPV